jgi:thiol:disulfide interchange protein
MWGDSLRPDTGRWHIGVFCPGASFGPVIILIGMKKFLFSPWVLGLLFLPFWGFAQSDTSLPVRWSFSASPSAPGTYILILRAKIQTGWRLFSVTMPDDLPNSRILLDSSARARITGLEEKGSLQSHKEPLFDQAEVRYFEDQVEIQVRLQSLGASKDIKGQINMMAIRKDSVVGPVSVPFRFSFDTKGNLVARTAGLVESADNARRLKRTSIDLTHPVNDCGGTGVEKPGSKSLLNIFILGFAGGLIALLTPCVFPMIPLTVSFFTKKTGEQKGGAFHAVLYGIFILSIYVLLSVPFYFLDSVNPEILNNISTNVVLNIIFFVVFIVFALSFFGLFEIALPSRIANLAGARSGAGGLVGIFFMALTLALVSFSCTGPILGSLLAGSLSTNGGAVQLSAGMAGFGFALALPFALFALFPGWLSSLPKSGGWLNSVKIVLGFLEVALAVKFLSNADLVEHWGILKREVFLGIWILTGICLVLYLFGLLQFKHDPPTGRLSKFRITVGLLCLGFVLYLLPGVFKTRYANLSLVSGFPPPLSYSIYGDQLVRLCGVEPQVRNDYSRAIQLANQQHKPVMIDFTGWACVNCRKMEENVWTSPEVKKLLEDDFVLVSLYVDDRQLLGEDNQFIFLTKEGYKKPIRTVGDEYATLQSENFVNSSQPLYVILSPEEKLLTYPVGYTPNSRDFAAWLRCGLEAYHKVP